MSSRNDWKLLRILITALQFVKSVGVYILCWTAVESMANTCRTLGFLWTLDENHGCEVSIDGYLWLHSVITTFKLLWANQLMPLLGQNTELWRRSNLEQMILCSRFWITSENLQSGQKQGVISRSLYLQWRKHRNPMLSISWNTDSWLTNVQYLALRHIF